MTYFSEKEQSCPHCGVINLADGFLSEMDILREICGHPLAVNSMCRCKEHNKAIGGAANSFHLTSNPWGCCAADININGWGGATKWRFIKLAMTRGFSIGVADSFIHVDLRRKYTDSEPVFYKYK